MDRDDLRPRAPLLLLIALRRGALAAFCLCVLSALVGLASRPASAEETRAERMVKLLSKRPRGMTKETWLEQRREAARELGRLKDKQAVPPLLKIVAKERLDVILEIAIDALGEIGDERAVDPLKRLLNDPSLDSYVRDAVAGALKKLGAKDEDLGLEPKPPVKPPPKPPVKPPPKPPEESPDGQPDLASRLAKEMNPFGDLPPLDLKLDANLLARSDLWEIAAGSADVAWDGRSERTTAAVGARSRYRRQVERKSYGYVVDGTLDLGFRLQDTSQSDAGWDLSHSLQVNPEIRYYPFKHDLPQLFGQVIGGVGYGLGVVENPLFLDRRLTFAGVVTVGGGPGYGRVIDVGARLRLARFRHELKRAGLLSGNLDKSIGDQIIYAWYLQRNQLGTYYHLAYALDILRKAGLLAKETVDPATSYRLIRILDDPQLDHRPAGLMLRLGYGYARTLVKDVDDTTMAFLYLTGEYTQQKVKRTLEARLRFFYEMYGDPDFYGLSVEGGYSHYFYASNLDPQGSLSAVLTAGLSNQPGSPFEDGGLGYQILAGGAFARYFNRGTKVVASLKAGVDTSNPLVLFTLEAQYGIAAGSFTSSE